MCGILFFASKAILSSSQVGKLDEALKKCKPRGPDDTQTLVIDFNKYFGFNRLAINDQTSNGAQPMTKHDCILICNGEIYNDRALVCEHNFHLNSHSDCEVILDLYHIMVHVNKSSIDDFLNELDGEFAFVLYDSINKWSVVARDHAGVRPLFMNLRDDHYKTGVYVSSTLAPIDRFSKHIEQVEPGHYYIVYDNFSHVRKYEYYRSIPKPENNIIDMDAACKAIRSSLTKAVEKRIHGEREICALLSGGLDSSLVAALAAQHFQGTKLKTFSIGIHGSPDLKYASIVAKHIGSDHHSIELTEQEFLNAIPVTIESIESYDVTSVRASVGNYLVAKYISEYTNCKVVLNGDYSDEVTGGYLYLHNAPCLEDFDHECQKLIKNICYFDSLRSDRCVGVHGLEGRMPFSDKDFIKTYWSVVPELRKHRVEKYLLRKAFDGTNLLPDEVLWRQKEAFSDGVSVNTRSWKTVIHDHVIEQVSFREYKEQHQKYLHCTPLTIEGYFYRTIYNVRFQNDKVIPYFWMPKWTDPHITDPSARDLPQYISC